MATTIQDVELAIPNDEFDGQRLGLVEVREIRNSLACIHAKTIADVVINTCTVCRHHDVLPTQKDVDLVARNTENFPELVGGCIVQGLIEREERVVSI